MTTEDEIIAIAKQQRIGVFLDSKARRDRLAWIFYKQNGACLAEFYSLADALAWLPKASAPHAN